MFKLLLLGLLVIPAAEIYVMIKVGSEIGAWPTVFLIIITALLGLLLIKSQGLATLQRVQASLVRGEPPAVAVIEGVILAFGGVLLFIPGFLTDALALVTLAPPIRRGIANWLIGRSKGRMSTGPRRGPDPKPGARSPPATGDIIEGEVIHEERPRQDTRLNRDTHR